MATGAARQKAWQTWQRRHRWRNPASSVTPGWAQQRGARRAARESSSAPQKPARRKA